MRRVLPSERADGSRDASVDPDHLRTGNSLMTQDRYEVYKSSADVLKAKLIELAGNSKKMWNTARQLLHSTPARTLSNEGCAMMSDTFCQFFTDKVARIQQEISEITQTMNQSLFQMLRLYTGSLFVAVFNISAHVLQVLSSLPNKSSPHDIPPILLLKSCADVFAPLIGQSIYIFSLLTYFYKPR